jgi:hypothetical protein
MNTGPRRILRTVGVACSSLLQHLNNVGSFILCRLAYEIYLYLFRSQAEGNFRRVPHFASPPGD